MKEFTALLYLFTLCCVTVSGRVLGPKHATGNDASEKGNITITGQQNGSHHVDAQNAIRGEKYRWTNKTIPYAFYYEREDDFLEVRRAMDEWQKYTCIEFRFRSSEVNYVMVRSSSSGVTDVGMRGWGEQTMYGYGSMDHNGILQELAHVIGLEHENLRPDRDDYVEVQWNVIGPEDRKYFEALSEWQVDTMDVPYDYMSVTHYPQDAYVRYNEKSLITKDTKYQDIIGSPQGLGFGDIQLVNKMYKCHGHCPEKECPDSGFLGKDCKCWCFSKKIHQKTCECGSPTCEQFNGDPMCRDKYEECGHWKEMNECNNIVSFMKKYCPVTCGYC